MRKYFTWRRVLLAIVLVILLAVGGFVVWATTVPEIMPEAKTALVDDSGVDVTEADWIEFMPVDAVPTTGYILYPGGKVPAEAYAPIAHDIAAQGYFVAIVHAPLNLAIFNSGAAQAVIDAHPEIKAWAVGGHSLGGVTASMFAKDNPGDVNGLVLMASVPFPGADLQNRTDLKVASIFGTRDGLLKPDEAQASAPDLPADTVFTAIEGGNHGQFGWYGPQAGDNEATTPRTEQEAQVVAATVDLLKKISGEEATE